jgi:tetratricopeptide (TPR) repeat protein
MTCRELLVSGLALWLLALWGSAFAAGEPAGCVPVARIVSIQGSLQIQRAGESTWSYIRRLDTVVCQGDLLHTGSTARAALLLSPETLFRVQQNSTVSIRQTPDETVVEYVIGEFQQPVRLAPNPCGAGYFITRFPKKFRVLTPFINASVEGTEFLVALSCQSATVAVFEGKVLAQQLLVADSSAFSLKDGEQVTVGGAEPPAVKLIVKPVDAVQWALYYPPLTQPAGEEVADQPCNQTDDVARGQCILQRAEQRLRMGRVEEAEADLETLSKIAPNSGEPYALRSIIRVTKNDKAEALALAERATQLSPDSSRTWIALSYAHQAAFDLGKALDAAREAAKVTPSSSTAQARAAELLMSLGRIRKAEEASRVAVQVNPADARAHLVLGFLHLAQVNTKAAREGFLAAIQLDSSDPLPRLGLGLALIRSGDLKAGREQIEIAVVLDPTNPLIRSYMGKTYYEENSRERDALAEAQFALAARLDPGDPTSWFYSGILKDAQTRPGEALRDLEKSTTLNENKAVFRSRLLLDEDLAARNTTQASVYNELGFSRLGALEASSSLAFDPGSASAHRFLADINATLPRHGIARASELLQAQLRQPLGAAPLQPQLANDVLFNNVFFGPETVGLNEFNPLFLRDKLGLQLFGLAGSENTYGDQLILTGLRGPVSFALSQFRAQTDGFRDNNDNDTRQYDAFLQVQPTYGTSVQFEFTKARSSSGDLETRFDPSNFDVFERNDDHSDTQRFGLRQAINPGSDIVLSVIRQKTHATFNSTDPLAPATIDVEQDSWKAEAQYLVQAAGVGLVAGVSYFEGNSDETFILEPDPPVVSHFDPRQENGYAYFYLPRVRGYPHLQLGASYDHLKSDVGDQKSTNPKLGVIWDLSDDLTLRAAGFRVLKRRFASDQGLEPTQVAGFNQFFDDANGTTSDSFGMGADLRISSTVHAGLQYVYRDLDVPYFNMDQTVFFQKQTEEGASAYLYWLANDRLSISFQPQYWHFNRGAVFDVLDLVELPVAIRFFLPGGIWIGASLTGVAESGKFAGVSDSDRFALLDAVIAYRLPRRLGTVSVQATNITNQKFKFQEIDPSVLPRYIPESRIVFRASLSF